MSHFISKFPPGAGKALLYQLLHLGAGWEWGTREAEGREGAVLGGGAPGRPICVHRNHPEWRETPALIAGGSVGEPGANRHSLWQEDPENWGGGGRGALWGSVGRGHILCKQGA